MNKIRSILAVTLASIFSLTLIACGNRTTESSEAQNTEEVTSEATDARTAEQVSSEDNSTASGTIVVYFSATGTTKGVAETIASVTNADIYEIVPAKPYTDEDLDYGDSNSRTSLEMNDESARPEIAGETISLDGYSTVYIGYPIWWGDAPRIMSTFVEAYNFDGKTVIPFCTSGRSEIGQSGKHLASQAGSGNWLDGARLNGGASEADIQSWIEGILKR
ncbi:MAG: flavodoxin [Butyrivibrio sp.]|nr:flavodoxin [Butyrivibrio sp.]